MDFEYFAKKDLSALYDLLPDNGLILRENIVKEAVVIRSDHGVRLDALECG